MAINCGALTLYSFPGVVVTINNRQVSGFWEGDDAVAVERATDIASLMVGADGPGVASITADQSATFVLRLQPNSPFNAYLSALARMQRSGVPRIMEVGVRDTSTGEGGGCTSAFIMKEPDPQWGATASVREWRIGCLCWQENDVIYNPSVAA